MPRRKQASMPNRKLQFIYDMLTHEGYSQHDFDVILGYTRAGANKIILNDDMRLCQIYDIAWKLGYDLMITLYRNDILTSHFLPTDNERCEKYRLWREGKVERFLFMQPIQDAIRLKYGTMSKYIESVGLWPRSVYRLFENDGADVSFSKFFDLAESLQMNVFIKVMKRGCEDFIHLDKHEDCEEGFRANLVTEMIFAGPRPKLPKDPYAETPDIRKIVEKKEEEGK